jgi:hypothetical protein
MLVDALVLRRAKLGSRWIVENGEAEEWLP